MYFDVNESLKICNFDIFKPFFNLATWYERCDLLTCSPLLMFKSINHTAVNSLMALLLKLAILITVTDAAFLRLRLTGISYFWLNCYEEKKKIKCYLKSTHTCVQDVWRVILHVETQSLVLKTFIKIVPAFVWKQKYFSLEGTCNILFPIFSSIVFYR